MSEIAEKLKNRTKKFALEVFGFVDELPNTYKCNVLSGQLIRSSTSTAANYRAACRGRSRAEFISKLGIVEEEVDESAFWLEFIHEAGLVDESRLLPLLKEANELTAIVTKSRKTAKGN